MKMVTELAQDPVLENSSVVYKHFRNSPGNKKTYMCRCEKSLLGFSYTLLYMFKNVPISKLLYGIYADMCV